MKKVLLSLASVLSVLVVGVYLFRAPLIEMAKEGITRDMFVADDTDNFDPGLGIDSPFPPLKTLYQGEVLTDTGQLIQDKGMVFIANRSVDW